MAIKIKLRSALSEDDAMSKPYRVSIDLTKYASFTLYNIEGDTLVGGVKVFTNELLKFITCINSKLVIFEDGVFLNARTATRRELSDF